MGCEQERESRVSREVGREQEIGQSEQGSGTWAGEREQSEQGSGT